MSVYIELIKKSDTIELSITNNFFKPIKKLNINRNVQLSPQKEMDFYFSFVNLFTITNGGNLRFEWGLGGGISGDKKIEYDIDSKDDDDLASQMFPFDYNKYNKTAEVTFEDGSTNDNVPIVFGPKPVETKPPPETTSSVETKPPPGPQQTAAPSTAAPSTAAPSTTKKPRKKRRRPRVTEPPKQNIMDMFNNRVVQILFLTFGIILFYIKNMLGNKMISAQSNILVVFLVIPAYIFLLHLRLKNK